MIDSNGPLNPRSKLGRLCTQIRACSVCAEHLPLGPRPIVRVDESVRVLITGQAPGTRVHETGLPWNDPSGDRLRAWLNVDRETFYDLTRFGVMAMGFCYPGRGKGGDLPPRPECAPLWHSKVRALLPNLKLTLLVGRYGQLYYLNTKKETLEATVKRYRDFLTQGFFPLPHPSPRNTKWLRDRPWFEREVITALRSEVSKALRSDQKAL